MVKTTDNFFFVAAYRQNQFNELQIARVEVTAQLTALAKDEKKARKLAKLRLTNISSQLLELAEQDGEMQLRKSQEFYKKAGIDMKRLEVGSLKTLELLHNMMKGSQISVYDQTQQYRRVLMYPELFCPTLVQINLVKIAYPKIVSGQIRGKEHSFHYHSTAKVHSLLAGQG